MNTISLGLRVWLLYSLCKPYQNMGIAIILVKVRVFGLLPKFDRVTLLFGLRPIRYKPIHIANFFCNKPNGSQITLYLPKFWYGWEWRQIKHMLRPLHHYGPLHFLLIFRWAQQHDMIHGPCIQPPLSSIHGICSTSMSVAALNWVGCTFICNTTWTAMSKGWLLSLSRHVQQPLFTMCNT